MKQEYKYEKEKALTSTTQLELFLINEMIEFAGAKPEDTIIDIDTRKFYEHCYNNFFEKLIDRNVKYLGLEPHFMTFSLQMKFMSIMTNAFLYDVEKIKLLEMAKEFIQDYEDFLNDNNVNSVQ